MVAREGSAPSISGCRPDVMLFHHRGENWLPGLDLHQHKRLQRALSYELDDPAEEVQSYKCGMQNEKPAGRQFVLQLCTLHCFILNGIGPPR